MFELLKNNGGCQLPCFWGLEPGKTSGQHIRAFLEKFRGVSVAMIFKESGGYVDLRIPENGLIINPSLEYEVNHNEGAAELILVQIYVLQEIEGGGYKHIYDNQDANRLLSSFTLDRILTTYGKPTEVWVMPSPGIGKEFNLLLYYINYGISIEYTSPLKQIGENYNGCVSPARETLYLWPPERRYSLADAAALIYKNKSIGQEWLSSFLPIEISSGISVEDFYQYYKEPKNGSCLKTPINIWPEP